MAHLSGWNPLRSGRAAALWGAGVAGATLGGFLWERRARRQKWMRGEKIEGVDKDRLGDLLSRLVATCIDGEHGFEAAAEGVSDPRVQSLFRQYSRQRHEFRLEVERMARRIGRSPEKTGTLPGTLHQAWVDIRAAIGRGDAAAILAEVERGEDSAVRTYREVLDAKLPADVADMVRRHLQQIRVAHDRILELRQSHASM